MDKRKTGEDYLITNGAEACKEIGKKYGSAKEFKENAIIVKEIREDDKI